MDISNLAYAKELINSLDLTPIIERLTRIEKWSQNEALAACRQYQNYFFLIKKYGQQYTLPPSTDIDEVWHTHILHTEDYSLFCEKVLGFFLHHHPHHGKSNTVTTQELALLFENNTQRLYFEEFGDYIYSVKDFFLRTKLNKVISHFKDFKITTRGKEA